MHLDDVSICTEFSFDGDTGDLTRYGLKRDFPRLFRGDPFDRWFRSVALNSLRGAGLDRGRLVNLPLLFRAFLAANDRQHQKCQSRCCRELHALDPHRYEWLCSALISKDTVQPQINQTTR